MHDRLIQIDPVSAKRIHPNDPQRLQRALEVYEITGKSLTELIDKSQPEIPYRLTKVILSPFDRSILHRRIKERYQNMMEMGFLDEVKSLYARDDCHAGLPAIRDVGYRQVWQHLAGDYDLDTSIEKAVIATRQMAKRQLTWLRAQDNTTWFDTGQGLPISQIMSFLLDRIPEFRN